MSDWSSYVCSSDLPCGPFRQPSPKRPDGRCRSGGKLIASARFCTTLFPATPFPGRSLHEDQRQRDPPWQHHRTQGPPVARCEDRSEEHTSELQSLMRISYAVFCLQNKTTTNTNKTAKKHIQQDK